MQPGLCVARRGAPGAGRRLRRDHRGSAFLLQQALPPFYRGKGAVSRLRRQGNRIARRPPRRAVDGRVEKPLARQGRLCYPPQPRNPTQAEGCTARRDASGRRRFLNSYGAFVLCFCPLQCGTMPNRGSAKQRRLFLSNDVRPQPQRREEGSPRRRHLLRVCRSRGRGVGRSDLGMGLSPGGNPGFVRWRSRHDHCRGGGALLPLLPHRLPASRHGGPDRKRSLFAVRVPPR